MSCTSEGDSVAFIGINYQCLLSLYELLSGLETTYPFPRTTKVEAGATIAIWRGNNVDLVLCVLLGHQNSKIANSMKLVNFALFSSQYHVFELKNIRGNLIAPNSNRWSLSNKIAMSQEDNRKIISLFGQEKSIFLHP